MDYVLLFALKKPLTVEEVLGNRENVIRCFNQPGFHSEFTGNHEFNRHKVVYLFFDLLEARPRLYRNQFFTKTILTTVVEDIVA